MAPEERPVKIPTTSCTITAAEPPTAARASAPHKLAHDDGVHGAVKLLKQGPDGDGEEKEQELFPDNPFGQVQVALGRFHGDPS